MNSLVKLILKYKKLIQILLIVEIFLNITSTVISQKDKYSRANYWDTFPQFKQLYLNSQYSNKNPIVVPDETVYAYAGGAFLKGANPILILPDVPPLGKYAVGLSILIFKNENTGTLIFGIISLLFLFLVGRQVLKDNLLALLPPFLWSFEPLFKNQFVYTPLFDIVQLMELLIAFYFFNKGLISERKSIIFFFIFNLFLGFFISTKFYMSGSIVLFAALAVLVLRRDRKNLTNFAITVPISLLILLASYMRVLYFGYGLRELFSVQKWIFVYKQGSLIKPLSIWPLFFLNKWYVWWGNKSVLSDSQWLVIWPIIGVISFLVIGLYMSGKVRKNYCLEILLFYTIFYFIFFSFGQTTVRYFIILIPVLYIISVYGVSQLAINKMKLKKI